MNSLSIISFVLSLVFMAIKGDYNDTNASISKEDIQELMNDFAQSLSRLYTDDSKDSLDEILEYFDNDNQEICYFAECVRKEHGKNYVREYLKNQMGRYIDTKITFQTKIKSGIHLEHGYFIKVNSAQYKTEIVDEQICESLDLTQYVFLLSTDLYIIKMIIIPSSKDSMYSSCEPIEPSSTMYDQDDNDNDDNEGVVCPPEEFCEVTDQRLRDYIMNDLSRYNMMDVTPDMRVRYIQIQRQNMNIRVIFESDKGYDIMVTYMIGSDGEVDMDSIKVQI